MEKLKKLLQVSLGKNQRRLPMVCSEYSDTRIGSYLTCRLSASPGLYSKYNITVFSCLYMRNADNQHSVGMDYSVIFLCHDGEMIFHYIIPMYSGLLLELGGAGRGHQTALISLTFMEMNFHKNQVIFS